ncbi:MAG: glycerol-3-phosphate acyltransferase [Anaerolineales bacterium]
MLAILVAYVLGSFPSAVLVSRAVAGVDIRTLGDGNMGARNTTRSLGWWPGIIVAILDFGKGAIAVSLARNLGADPNLQLLSGTAAVIGHDFPIWAHFRGGQGMATSLGVLMLLVPEPTLWGLVIFASSYVILRHFDLSAALGLGLIVALLVLHEMPLLWVLYAALLFISIGLKKWLDLPRRLANLRSHPENHV